MLKVEGFISNIRCG